MKVFQRTCLFLILYLGLQTFANSRGHFLQDFRESCQLTFNRFNVRFKEYKITEVLEDEFYLKHMPFRNLKVFSMEGAYGVLVKADDVEGQRVTLRYFKDKWSRHNKTDPVLSYDGGGLIRRNRDLYARINPQNNNPLYLDYLGDGVDPLGNHYIVFNYFEGIPLRRTAGEFLKSLNIDELPHILADLFDQGLEGINGLHELGYVHLDVKPENILVNRSLRLKLIDLEGAMTYEEIQKTSGIFSNRSLMVTPGWGPDELKMRFTQKITKHVDYYSLAQSFQHLIQLIVKEKRDLDTHGGANRIRDFEEQLLEPLMDDLYEKRVEASNYNRVKTLLDSWLGR